MQCNSCTQQSPSPSPRAHVATPSPYHNPPPQNPTTKHQQVEIIKALPDDATISLYRCGPMVDLCHGPHLPSTGLIKAVAVTNASRAFWRADVTKEPLQRVYAVTFPDKALLKDYQHRERHG